MKKHRYRVLRPYNGAAPGEIISMNSAQGNRRVDDGTVERVGPEDLELRIAEYEHRILTGNVRPGEVVLLRGMEPPTVARIHSRAPSGFKVVVPGKMIFSWLDFNPIDWSRFWVDSGMRIQRWEDVETGHVEAIAKGSYEHRPGADEAAEREVWRRSSPAKKTKHSLADLMGRPLRSDRVNIEPISYEHDDFVFEGMMSKGDAADAIALAFQIPVNMLTGYAPSGLSTDAKTKSSRSFSREHKITCFDDERSAARYMIAKRLGIQTRHVSDEMADYEIKVQARALAARQLKEKRAPENTRMQARAFEADVRQFLENRFDLEDTKNGLVQYEGESESALVYVKFNEVEVEFQPFHLGHGRWGWTDETTRQHTAPSLSQACDDFEAWVHEQFVVPESKPRLKVTVHIGTGDMGSYGTGGHR